MSAHGGNDDMTDNNTDTPFTAFERAQDAMITEFLAMLRQPGGMGVSEATAIVDETVRQMLCTAAASLKGSI